MFKLVDEHGSLSTQDLLNKVVSEISDNEERYAAYYAGPLADYLMGDTIMLFTMIEKFQKTNWEGLVFANLDEGFYENGSCFRG